MKYGNLNTVLAVALILLAAAAPLAAQSDIISSEAYASWYGEEFQGRPTSSGELFDMNAYTAAHKTLPFGTMLEVTNLDNGKKVTVRVNDRGPFVEDRELDVSRAAAVELEMISTGMARVSIRKLADTGTAGSATSSAAAAPAPVAPVAPVTAQTVPINEPELTVPAQAPAPAAAAAPAYAAPAAPAPVAPAPAAAAAPVQAPAPAYVAPAAPAPVAPAPAAAAAPVQAPAPAYVAPAAPAPVAPAPAAAAAPVQAPAPAYVAPAAPAPVAPALVAAAAPVQTPAPAAMYAAPAPVKGVSWRIQLGSFSREENATRLIVKLRKAGFNPAFEKSGTMTRVVIASIPDADLSFIKEKLRLAGYSDYIVRQESW